MLAKNQNISAEVQMSCAKISKYGAKFKEKLQIK